MRLIASLKNWQVDAFQVGRLAQYFLIQSPGGAGKSLLQVLLAQADILGPLSKPLTLPKVKQVVVGYLKKGVRLHRKYGDIPELGMSSYNLADRLKRNFSVTLTELVNEVETTLAE